MDHREKAKDYASPMSYFQYDQVAVPRIAKMLTELGLRQTFFVPAWCIERYPATFERVREGDHEIAVHGFLHERPSRQTDEGERFWLERAIEVLERFTGRRPSGYSAPWADVSDRTMDLLVEEGFLYESSLLNDDNPYVLRTGAGDIVELPTDYQTSDDWSQFGHVIAMDFMMQPQAPERAAEVWMAEFEAAYLHGGMFITGFHPFLSGRLARLATIRRMLEEMIRRGDVWIATMDEIAQHVRQCMKDGTYVPRVVDWPLCEREGVAELQTGYVEESLALR